MNDAGSPGCSWVIARCARSRVSPARCEIGDEHVVITRHDAAPFLDSIDFTTPDARRSLRAAIGALHPRALHSKRAWDSLRKRFPRLPDADEVGVGESKKSSNGRRRRRRRLRTEEAQGPAAGTQESTRETVRDNNGASDAPPAQDSTTQNSATEDSSGQEPRPRRRRRRSRRSRNGNHANGGDAQGGDSAENGSVTTSKADAGDAPEA